MRILIVRLSSLGDIVHTFPVVNDLLTHVPGAEIDWVVEENYQSLVALHKGIQTVIPIGLRRWRKQLLRRQSWQQIKAFMLGLRRTTYDVVLDAQGLIKSGLVMQAARLRVGGRRIGLANATLGSGYEGASRVFHHNSVAVPKKTHAITRSRLLAATALGYTIHSTAEFNLEIPDLAPTWLPHRPYVVFFHGTARIQKSWPVEHWRHIANRLSRQGWPVLLPWGNPAEQEQAQAIALHIPEAIVLPALSLLEAIKLAQSAHVALGVDTGLTHLAAAYGRATIELYCDSPRWKTEGNWSPDIVNLGDSGAPPSCEEVETALQRFIPLD